MRICVFTSNTDLGAFDQDNVLSRVKYPLGEDTVEDLYVVGYQPLDRGIPAPNFYVVQPRNRYAAVGHRLLRIIDAYRWISPTMSFVPLWLFRDDLLEVLLACDPDVVVIQDVRWASQLKRLLKKSYSQWACLVEGEAWSEVNLRRRKFESIAKVSIVLPTYNGTKYLHQSIESCLDQTYRNIELIIVDDGSTEDIREIVGVFADSRIRLLRHDRNRGVAEALNTGFRSATGQYLTWTSDDNFYAKSAVEELVRYLETYPAVDFVYAERYNVDERTGGRTLWVQRTLPAWSLSADCGIGACFLYKRKVYEAIGDYDPTAFLNEDYDYWIRVSREFRMQRLFKPLYYYRYHGKSLTGRYGAQEINQRAKLVWQRNHKRDRPRWGKLFRAGWSHGDGS